MAWQRRLFHCSRCLRADPPPRRLNQIDFSKYRGKELPVNLSPEATQKVPKQEWKPDSSADGPFAYDSKIGKQDKKIFQEVFKLPKKKILEDDIKRGGNVALPPKPGPGWVSLCNC
jgi:hypothetical protein